MELDLISRLKKVRENSSFIKAKHAYIVYLSDIFLRFPTLLKEVCKSIDTSAEELISLLENPSSIDITFLDQLLELSSSGGKLKKNSVDDSNQDFYR